MSRSQFQDPRGFTGRIAGQLMAWMNAPMNRLALEALDLHPGQAVLEIGFGPGVLLGEIARRLGDGLVAGVDPSATMRDVARRRNRKLVEAGRVQLVDGSASRIPWSDPHFDRVVSVNAIYFWPEPASDLREIARVLKPGGRLVVVFRVSRRPPYAMTFTGSSARDKRPLGEVEGWCSGAGFDAVTSQVRRAGMVTAATVVAVRP